MYRFDLLGLWVVHIRLLLLIGGIAYRYPASRSFASLVSHLVRMPASISLYYDTIIRMAESEVVSIQTGFHFP